MGHKIPQEMVTQMKNSLANRNLDLLTTLYIRDGRWIDDKAAQTLIERLPQLQDLTIRRAVKMTDSGLTGIPIGACKSLLDSGGHSALTTIGVGIQATGRCISELRKLFEY
jgi:hypothetical protein